MKVLITGAAGVIGKILVRGLRDRHELRGFDCEPMPELADAMVGDINNFDQVKAATEGMDVQCLRVGSPKRRAPDRLCEQRRGSAPIILSAHDAAHGRDASQAGQLLHNFQGLRREHRLHVRIAL